MITSGLAVICPGAGGTAKLTMTALYVLSANLMNKLEWLAADATFEVPTYGTRTG